MAGEINKLFWTIGAKIEEYTDAMIKVQNKATETQQKTGEAANQMSINWGKVTAVVGGVALGVEALARQQAPLTESTRKLAASIGVSEDEMRKLAIETANVTFPLESVLAVMERGRQQGIKSAEVLKEYATYWDVVGDATGENAAALAEAGVALRAVGIAVGEESEALSALGYISRETTLDVREFLDFIGRAGPELRQMGMDVNDAAAVLGILEHELGMTGRTAKSEFTQAVSEADGVLKVLLDTLGITTEQFEAYKQKVGESSEVIAENAKIHADSYTALQKLQHAVSEATYSMGNFIGSASNVAPALTGAMAMINLTREAQKLLTWWTGAANWQIAIQNIKLGILTFMSTAATVAVGLLGRAMLFLSGPVGWAALAIIAVITAGYLLIKNWDTVKEKAAAAWGVVTTSFQDFKDGAVNAINTVIGWINKLIDAINKIPGVNLGKIGTIGGGKIPGLAAGGTVTRPGSILVGEQGPEVLTLPAGAMVTPLSGGGSTQRIEHTGTIRVEGINDRNQLMGVVNLIARNIADDNRRLPNRVSLYPVG